MPKVITIEYEKCVGCMTCLQACSASRSGVVSPSLSRIGIVQFQLGSQSVPIVCNQCEPAPCKSICPVEAISRDESLGRMVVDHDVCISCRMCVAICPFGCMIFNSNDNKVFKCDLCDGDPICVKFCQHDSLQYVDAGEQSASKMKKIAEQVMVIKDKISTE